MRCEERTVETREQSLVGHTYVVTGTLARFTRSEACDALRARGAKVTGSVSAKVTGLVAGDGPGSKLDKALAANVPVLDEADLVALLG